MEYRLDQNHLLAILAEWNRFEIATDRTMPNIDIFLERLATEQRI